MARFDSFLSDPWQMCSPVRRWAGGAGVWSLEAVRCEVLQMLILIINAPSDIEVVSG